MGRLGWIVRKSMEVKVMNMSGTQLGPIIKSSLINVFYINNYRNIFILFGNIRLFCFWFLVKERGQRVTETRH